MSRWAWLMAGALALSGAAWADQSRIQLVFVGDLMLDDGPGKVIARGGDPLANFDADLRDSDFTIGNLECPIAAKGEFRPSKIFTFRADPRVLRVLKGRFQAVALANNHSGDAGRNALLETMTHLDAAGIHHFGAGRNLAEAHAPLWIRQNGINVAVLSYNEFKPRSFEAGPDWPGIAWSEDEQVLRDIRLARKAGADLVIPFMHWGWEREPEPTQRQREFARKMIDYGADAVVGGHPHITQGAEYYRGKPIVYSLGNFVFDSFKTDATRTGWLLRMALSKRGVERWETVPAFMDEEGVPQRVPGARTPCGAAGETVVRLCESR